MRARPPAVAGSFYPADPERLRLDVDALLAAAAQRPRRKALVVPHAGYVYSGAVAASAYASLAGAKEVHRVVLLGPSHFARLSGLCLPAADALDTPLGRVRLDDALPDVPRDDGPHAEEHALEVQLPFLQRALGEFRLVPLVVGRAAPSEVAEVLAQLWGGPETLVVVSTDLSHYLPYAEARRVDAETADAVVQLRSPLNPERACGARPLNGLLEVARERKMTAERWDLRSSGDTAGPRDRVVGYGAFGFAEAA